MANVGDLKLLGAWPSPFVLRPRIALNLKSLSYEFLEQNLGNKSQLLLQSNPVHKKIPVLLHNDKPICESLIIVEYIDDAFPSSPSILPSDPYDRAIARFWASYIDDKWFPSLSTLGKAQNDEDRVTALEPVLAGLQLLEGAFEKCSQGKAFFGGDTIGFLDIALGCYLGWIKTTIVMTGINLLEKTPLLAEWSDRFCSDPAVQNVMPETEKLIEFAKRVFAKPPSA